MPMKPVRRLALRTSLAYGLFAALWIVLSDRALVMFVSDPRVISRLSIYKGWAFVAITGFLLYATLRARLQRWQQEVSSRIQAEQDLRESEEHYRVAIESSNDGVVLLRGERPVFVNQRFLAMFGYREEEIVGKPLFLTVHPDDRAIVAGYALQGDRAGPAPSWYEFRGITKDGVVKHIEASVARVTFRGAPAGLAYLRDVTERKKVEESLRASRLQLAEAADMANIAHWEHDATTDEFLFNDAFYNLYRTTADLEGGYRMAREEYVSRFVHPDDLEEIRRQIAANRADPRTRRDLEQYEHRGVRRDGEVIHVLARNRVVADSDGSVLRVVGVNQDITARKEMEDALRESETKLRAILDGSRDAIGVSKRGTHTYVNPAYVSLFGFESARELIGSPITGLVAPESRGFLEDRVNREARGDSLPPFYEATALRKDGTTFLMEATTSSYLLKGEEFALAILRDISEKKRLEEQLRQAQKMEAVGTLAGGVAHDFNNILTVIMGLGNLLQMSMDKDDIHRPHVDQIVASSERAADLTQSLLAFSRKQRITLEPHTVNGVVTSTAKLLARLLPEDIILSMDLCKDDTTSLLDVSQIGQVLMNLATNARDAMPGGGALTIRTHRTLMDEGFVRAQGFGRTGNYVRLSISDTGIGMDDQTMARIFEPFFTTKEVGKGTGLGLASAYGTVKQHSGYITVSSLPSRGTVFDIYLPLLDTSQGQVAPDEEEIKGGSETILIVEDDRDVRNMLVKILESQGYATIEAFDGDDAIQVHRVRGGQIDLMIVDVVMPGKNGKEAFDEISRVDPGVKVLFVSGYTGDVVIDKGIHSETVDFLHKPLSVTTLLSKVREVLDR